MSAQPTATSPAAASTSVSVIPAGTWKVDPVHSSVEFQVKHLGIAQSVTKKDKSKMQLVGQGVTLSRTPSRFVAPPPALGEHTDAVLKEFGFSAREIAALHKAKAV